MKKHGFLLVLIIIVSFTLLSAGGTRVATMGSSAVMLPDDDANIDLFPQRINDWNIIRFEGISGGSPTYLFTTGDAGAKWGFYGGSSTTSDFINVYRSLSTSSAVRLGVQFSTRSETDKNNDNEPSGYDDETIEKRSTIDISALFGSSTGDREIAVYGQYVKGPSYLSSTGMTVSSIEYSDNAGSSSEGLAGTGMISFGGRMREKRQIALFENFFASASFTRYSTTSEYKSGSTDMEDLVSSRMIIRASTQMFNEVEINETSRMVYGVGTRFSIDRYLGENKLTGQESRITDNDITLVAPTMTMGFETDLKYGQFRFGFTRGINLFDTSSESDEYISGTVDDTEEESIFSIGQNGYYSFASGFGVNYGGLQVDIILNNNFWVQGPQMIFNDTSGSIGLAADLIFTF